MKTIRWVLAVAMGAGAAIGLLVLMYALIKMGDSEVKQEEYRTIGDIWQEEQKIDDNVKKLKPKKPDDPIEPPPEVPPDEVDMEQSADSVRMQMPTIDNSAGIKIGGFGGDGEFIPLVKILPQYPRRALERGIEGYATVEFIITKTVQHHDCYMQV